MIQKLRRKMTLLVLLALFVILCLFVGSINYVNWKNLETQAFSTLELLAANRGKRPGLPERADRPYASHSASETPPPKPTIKDNEIQEQFHDHSNMGFHRELKDSFLDQEILAGLSNSYTIFMDSDGSVSSWFSEREDLYSEEQIKNLATEIQAGGREKGRIGSQYFISSGAESGEMIIVLDERIEYMSAQELLRNTLFMGMAVYLLLGSGAFLSSGKCLYLLKKHPASKSSLFGTPVTN